MQEKLQDFEAKCYHIEAKHCHLIQNPLRSELFCFTSWRESASSTVRRERRYAKYSW
ncbi:hypothetical protein [Dysgonomonas sp. 25]|uniref:hypothetical protein n=1 Tax=Dysgonomonas sp. 25 TaxID=2302933 RepID=UPI0013CFD533|nr:hypothetical protein [Dysgonomonas sp. 25]